MAMVTFPIKNCLSFSSSSAFHVLLLAFSKIAFYDCQTDCYCCCCFLDGAEISESVFIVQSFTLHLKTDWTSDANILELFFPPMRSGTVDPDSSRLNGIWMCRKNQCCWRWNEFDLYKLTFYGCKYWKITIYDEAHDVCVKVTNKNQTESFTMKWISLCYSKH